MTFFFYSIGVVFTLVNIFLSIIIKNFKSAKLNNDLQSDEYEIVDFMTTIYELVGIEVVIDFQKSGFYRAGF